MSYPKPKPKSSVKAAFGAVRDFIGGYQDEEEGEQSPDYPAVSASNDDEVAETKQPLKEHKEPSQAELPPQNNAEAKPSTQDERRTVNTENKNTSPPPQNFDQAVRDLRAGKTPEARIAAARTLATAGGQRATPHLIAALFDPDSTVRGTANELLAELGNSSLSSEALAEAPPKPSAPKQSGVPKQQPATPAATTQAPAKARAEESAAVITPEASASLSKDPQELLVEENEVRAKVKELEQQVTATIAARKQAEKQIREHIEGEAELRSAAAARREQEEQLRKQAAAEAERRQAEDANAIAAEVKARISAEKETRRLAEEEERLRLESARRRQAADQLVRDRFKIEQVRAEAAEADQLSELKRIRQEATEQHQSEVERLRHDEETLRAAFEKVAHRRAEVETARAKAEKEAELLVEARARMRAAEEARNQAEAERLKLESDINERLATERRQLEETRKRGKEEQQRLEEEARRVAEEGQARLKELSELRQRSEAEAKQRAEKEQQLLAQLESLRISDAETRKRIEEAEMRKHTAEEAYKLAAEKLQRIEAEAHARAHEEEQMAARLESTRRTVAVEAQARAEQEKRIKEEIEMFHRLEEEERPRLEAAVLQRKEVEERFRALRERYELEQQALATAEQFSVAELTPEVVEATDLPAEEGEATPVTLVDAGTVAEPAPAHEARPQSGEVPAAIAAYLASIDPYKRAAAVAELGRSTSPEAFKLISNAFDDSSPHVRNAAARALRKLEPMRTVDLFNRALEEGSDERRRSIGAAIAASGVAAEAIENLVSESREETYNSLSILFVMAKTGEVQPLIKAIEEHENDEVRRAVVKLLNLSGQSQVADAALQRHVLGVPAARQNGVAKQPDQEDVRLTAAEVEVKRAVRKTNDNN